MNALVHSSIFLLDFPTLKRAQDKENVPSLDFYVGDCVFNALFPIDSMICYV